MKNNHANSGKRGSGRPTTKDLAPFRREAQREFRAWCREFSDGKGLGSLSSDCQTLLRTARLIRLRLLELEALDNPSDNQIKLSGNLASTLSRILGQIDKLI